MSGKAIRFVRVSSKCREKGVKAKRTGLLQGGAAGQGYQGLVEKNRLLKVGLAKEWGSMRVRGRSQLLGKRICCKGIKCSSEQLAHRPTAEASLLADYFHVPRPWTGRAAETGSPSAG